MTAPSDGSTRAEEAAALDRGRVAFEAGRYRDAFSQLHSSLLTRALRWFREEGVQFQRPPEEIAPTELILGLAYAAQSEVAERGDAAGRKLEAAALTVAAIAELRIALERRSPETADEMHEFLAELTIRSGMLGQLQVLMDAEENGWFDKLEEYDADRSRRRAGAEVVNARRADAKQRGLNEAVRITGRNPTLSNEEIARKLIDAAGLSTTVRTATDWVREWRRQGYLPQTPQTQR